MNTARSHVVPVHAKAISYHVNGTGRDTYISYNNGGITRNGRVPAFSMSGALSRPSSASRPMSVRLEAKTLHYHSDGTGRDSYIVVNEGGLSNSWGVGRNRSGFLNNLRGYEKLRPYNPSRPDYFDWAQRKMTVKQLEENRQKATLVKNLVTRLSPQKLTRNHSTGSLKKKISSDYF